MTSGKGFGLKVSMGQYCVLVGGWETDVGFKSSHWPGTITLGMDVLLG